jgi:hypothetical protein
MYVYVYSYLLTYEDGKDSIPKRRCLNYRRQGITQNKVCDTENKQKFEIITNFVVLISKYLINCCMIRVDMHYYNCNTSRH